MLEPVLKPLWDDASVAPAARLVCVMQRRISAVEDGSGEAFIFIVALRLVYGLQFGAVLCVGRVIGCEIVQRTPLQLFALAPGLRGRTLWWVVCCQPHLRQEFYTNTDAITPPRHGMIEDTKARKLSATTNMDP